MIDKFRQIEKISNSLDEGLEELKIEIESKQKEYQEKVSKGIEKIYTEANLTNDFKEVQKLHGRFFGYLTKSKNAKEKWA